MKSEMLACSLSWLVLLSLTPEATGGALSPEQLFPARERRWRGPLREDLRASFPSGATEESGWARGPKGEFREGLFRVTDSSGSPVAQGYFRLGRRVGTWLSWSSGLVREEYWSGALVPDSMSVPMDAANSVAIDFAAAEPKSGFGYAGQGSYYWSLEAAGRDSVRMKWQLEQEGGSSPIWQYRIPRSSGLAVFRRASSGLLLFRDKLKPWFEAQIQPASREPSYETNYVIEPVAADSLASPQKLKN